MQKLWICLVALLATVDFNAHAAPYGGERTADSGGIYRFGNGNGEQVGYYGAGRRYDSRRYDAGRQHRDYRYRHDRYGYDGYRRGYPYRGYGYSRQGPRYYYDGHRRPYPRYYREYGHPGPYPRYYGGYPYGRNPYRSPKW